MLTESDRKEIMYIIKEFLTLNGVEVSVVPRDFTYEKVALDTLTAKVFERLLAVDKV